MSRWQAVGTDGDRIVFLGDSAQALAMDWDEKRDLEGAMVLPAFNDTPPPGSTTWAIGRRS